MTKLNIEELTPHERAVLGSLFQQRELLLRIARQVYDHSNPVDEWSSQATPPPVGSPVAIQPDYEIPERIDCITASLPVGITGAVVDLGQRSFTLYSGAATTVQTVVNLNGIGMILSRSDERQITFTGAPTTGYYFGLTGYCLEREGNR
jgi:hypothetical protein